MLPKMRETGEKFRTRPHLEVVTSDTHYMARFGERDAQGGILKALNNEEGFNGGDRYGCLILTRSKGSIMLTVMCPI